jgi:arylsulfatase
VLPIDDRSIERTNAALAGRPDVMAGRTSLTVYEGMKGMSENVFINTKNRSHTVTAEVTIPTGGANGVILAQAGRFGGWSLYLKDGKPMYAYNYLGLGVCKVASPRALPEGAATIRFEFQYDGSGLTHSDIEAVPDKRSPSLFSAEGVGLARGFWLVVLLLFNLVLWAGLGWMVVLHPK